LKLTEFFKRSSQQAPTNTAMVVGRLYGNQVLPTGILNTSNAMTNSDIYSVVSLISSDIAGMHFNTVDYVDKVLNKPSTVTNSYNFWQSVVAKMLLYGNAYCLINKDKDGNLSGLELIQDEQVMSLEVGQNQSLTYAIHFYDERPDTYYDSSELLHFKLVSVGSDFNSQYFGISPLVSLVPELGLQSLSNKLAESALQNAINPSVLISVPDAQLDKEVKDNMRTAFVDQTTGDNFGKPIVLDASQQLTTLGVKPEITNMLSNVNFAKEQISKAFGINSGMLNGEGDAQSNLDQMTSLYNSSLQRYMNPIKYELEAKLNVPIQMSADITDDAVVTRINTLVTNQIISAADAQQLLKSKGII